MDEPIATEEWFLTNIKREVKVPLSAREEEFLRGPMGESALQRYGIEFMDAVLARCKDALGAIHDRAMQESKAPEGSPEQLAHVGKVMAAWGHAVSRLNGKPILWIRLLIRRGILFAILTRRIKKNLLSRKK